MAKNRYFQTTKGFNAEVIVAGAVAYTSRATMALFVANAVEGEIGIYNADTDALIAATASIGAPNTPALATATGAGSIAAGTYFYKITAINGAGETVGSGEASITTTTSSSTNTLSWNAVPGATSYRVYRGTVTNTEDHFQTTASTTFSDTSAVGGTSGTVPTTSTAVAAASVAAGTKMYIAQKRDALIHKTTPLVYNPGVAIRTAFSAAVADVWTITGFPTPAAGQVYSFAIFDLSSGSQPFQAYDYEYVVKTGQTLGQILDAIVLVINNTANPVNQAFGPIVTASQNSNTDLIFTAVANTPIRIASREDTQSVTVTHTTPYQQGIGTFDNVSQLEDEGIIFAGVTTNYPAPINALPSEFGTATKFSKSTLGYNLYMFNFYESEASPLPLERHFQKKYQVLAIPSTGTTPEAAVKAILGL